MRLLNLIVIVALVVAAAYVYRIKFDSTVQAERVAKLHALIRQDRDSIAQLRAEWARLDAPDRIEQLARRHLTLKPEDATQFDNLDGLPARPAPPEASDNGDQIGTMIENLEDADTLTGTVARPATRPVGENAAPASEDAAPSGEDAAPAAADR